jgi:hypothetical protein
MRIESLSRISSPAFVANRLFAGRGEYSPASGAFRERLICAPFKPK